MKFIFISVLRLSLDFFFSNSFFLSFFSVLHTWSIFETRGRLLMCMNLLVSLSRDYNLF